MHRQSHSQNPILHRVLTIAVATALGALAPVGSASAYTHQTLHSFCNWANCGDGGSPNGLLQDSSGNLYGSTQTGGGHGEGVVFELIPNADKSKYSERRLYSFCKKANCKDGAQPWGDLIMDIDGNLYGTTAYGGNSDEGVVFRLAPGANSWTNTILHSFCQKANCTDGAEPYQGLSYEGQSSGALWNESAPLFGTTTISSLGGLVYQIITKPSLHYAVVHNFSSGMNAQPVLVTESALFGTTSSGGKYGGGVLYRLAAGTWKETTLHNFCADANCADGSYPEGKLFVDAVGNIFGTTEFGGANSSCNSGKGCGAVFERPTAGGYNVAYNFCSLANCIDGANPYAGLVMDGAGNLFGTTSAGGADSQLGVVFELAPGGAESVLYQFCPEGGSCTNGAVPATPVILDGQGGLFGTTSLGGANGKQYGTVFRLTP